MAGAASNSSHYLDRLMRRGSFEALAPLFAHAERPAKEMTESFSALLHLRPFLTGDGPHRVIHVGDGAHARTGAMFALKTSAHNVSVDPVTNVPLLERWRERFGVRRFEFWKASVQNSIDALNALPPMPTLVTFVHAHVQVDDVLQALKWDAAYTLACCVPGKQLTTRYAVRQSGLDEHVMSADRTFQVLVNQPAT